MTTVNFEKVSLTAIKSCKCKGCGKTIRRQKKFYQTINPFNKNKDGRVKTRKEILKELKERIATWNLQDEWHEKCLISDNAKGSWE